MADEPTEETIETPETIEIIEEQIEDAQAQIEAHEDEDETWKTETLLMMQTMAIDLEISEQTNRILEMEMTNLKNRIENLEHPKSDQSNPEQTPEPTETPEPIPITETPEPSAPEKPTKHRKYRFL